MGRPPQRQSQDLAALVHNCTQNWLSANLTNAPLSPCASSADEYFLFGRQAERTSGWDNPTHRPRLSVFSPLTWSLRIKLYALQSLERLTQGGGYTGRHSRS